MDNTVRKLDFRNIPKDGDGDDGFIPVHNVVLSKVSNGWIITTMFDDEDQSETVEVFDVDGKDNGDLQALKCLISTMGLEGKVSVREK